jgi:hypothetical protein
MFHRRAAARSPMPGALSTMEKPRGTIYTVHYLLDWSFFVVFWTFVFAHCSIYECRLQQNSGSESCGVCGEVLCGCPRQAYISASHHKPRRHSSLSSVVLPLPVGASVSPALASPLFPVCRVRGECFESVPRYIYIHTIHTHTAATAVVYIYMKMFGGTGFSSSH